MRKLNGWTIALWLVVVLFGSGVLKLDLPALPNLPWPSLPIVTPSTPPRIVILYESSHGPLPPYALGAANELRAAGREVHPIDDDGVTGPGDVPVWLKPAIEPGRAIMGGTDGKDRALVLLDGDKVVKAVKLPETREAIVEACK